MSAASDASSPKYRGVMEQEGRWLAYVVDRNHKRFDVAYFNTPEAAALAHDRVLIYILGPAAGQLTCNFRPAFSHMELRFLHGRHAPRLRELIAMLRNGMYETEFDRFAARAFNAGGNMEFNYDMADFRLCYRNQRQLRMEAAVTGITDWVAQMKAERDAERELFMKTVKNKATDAAWRIEYLSKKAAGLSEAYGCKWPIQISPQGDEDEGIEDELIHFPPGVAWWTRRSLFDYDI